MKFLVFQHIACEHPGIFRDLMQESGITWETVELDREEPIPNSDHYDALLVMGGPMDVWQLSEYPWLRAEQAAIRQWVTAGRPYLGLCLGHQLLAVAMGGEVGPAAEPEIGVMPVALTEEGRAHWLFRNCPAVIQSLQWHSAEVITPPDGAVVLAQSEACLVNAMAWGERAVSVQFHVEITDTTVSEWGQVPEYAMALERACGPGAMADMQREADRYRDDFRHNARILFENFLSRVS